MSNRVKENQIQFENFDNINRREIIDEIEQKQTYYEFAMKNFLWSIFKVILFYVVVCIFHPPLWFTIGLFIIPVIQLFKSAKKYDDAVKYMHRAKHYLYKYDNRSQKP